MNAEKVRERSRAAFDGQAGEYDVSRWGRHARGLYPSVIEAIEPHVFTSLLDVGCETGAILAVVSRRWPHARLAGIDLSPRMVDVARRKLDGRATVVRSDAVRLPYDDSTFDVVLCVDSFHHYPHPQRVLGEVQRVLRPRGRFILADVWLPHAARFAANALLRFLPYGDVRVYSEGELVILAARAGLSEVRRARAGKRGQLVEFRRSVSMVGAA